MGTHKADINSLDRVHPVPLKGWSGFEPRGGAIPVVKGHHYQVFRALQVSGDAPKDFVRVYEHQWCRKVSSRRWPLYIAKVGDKHYPMESITEHLLNRCGEILGMRMASSRLARLGGQVRFMSRYFLDDPMRQELVHGANIYSGYLSNDQGLVEEIERQGLSRDLFTVQFTRAALRFMFPVQADKLLEDLLRMLVFDAYVGNNDRHFYNWGVIRNLSEGECPRFSPIYDTARGLFWNDHEDKLGKLAGRAGELPAFIRKYCEGSRPKIGWEGRTGLNHFELIAEARRIMPPAMLDEMRALVSMDRYSALADMLSTEFQGLVSAPRAMLIQRCLAYRRDRLAELLR